MDTLRALLLAALEFDRSYLLTCVFLATVRTQLTSDGSLRYRITVRIKVSFYAMYLAGPENGKSRGEIDCSGIYVREMETVCMVP